MKRRTNEGGNIKLHQRMVRLDIGKISFRERALEQLAQSSMELLSLEMFKRCVNIRLMDMI